MGQTQFQGARDLFDEDLLREQRRDLEESLIAELSERFADRVFDRILSRIP